MKRGNGEDCTASLTSIHSSETESKKVMHHTATIISEFEQELRHYKECHKRQRLGINTMIQIGMETLEKNTTYMLQSTESQRLSEELRLGCLPEENRINFESGQERWVKNNADKDSEGENIKTNTEDSCVTLHKKGRNLLLSPGASMSSGDDASESSSDESADRDGSEENNMTNKEDPCFTLQQKERNSQLSPGTSTSFRENGSEIENGDSSSGESADRDDYLSKRESGSEIENSDSSSDESADRDDSEDKTENLNEECTRSSMRNSGINPLTEATQNSSSSLNKSWWSEEIEDTLTWPMNINCETVRNGTLIEFQCSCSNFYQLICSGSDFFVRANSDEIVSEPVDKWWRDGEFGLSCTCGRSFVVKKCSGGVMVDLIEKRNIRLTV